MSCNKTAVVRMEEGYMRLTIQYDDHAYKPQICKDIVELEKKLDIYPEVIHRRDSESKWSCSVEFSGDEYICSRTCGNFIETLIHDLGIEHCEND